MDENKMYESVHNYTKYKLVEMLITKHNEGRLKLDNLNSIEDLADDVLEILSLCGLKFYSQMKGNSDNDNRN